MGEEASPFKKKSQKYCSKKFSYAPAKYEVGLSVFKSKCVWISGPFYGGVHDLNMYRAGLKEKAKNLKGPIIADRGYRTKKTDEARKF